MGKHIIKQLSIWGMILSVTLMVTVIIFVGDIMFTLTEVLKVCGMVTLLYILSHVVEHINKDPLDNCVDNLVWIKSYVVKKPSPIAKLIGRSSKYCNVYLNKDENKWECSIRINGVKQLIGSFEDEYEAAIAHKNKLEMIMGLFESTLPQELPAVIV